MTGRRVPHAVSAVVLHDPRPSDISLARPAIDADEAVPAPVDAVVRLRVLHVVVGAERALNLVPCEAGHVPHAPSSILVPDAWRRDEARIDVAPREERSAAHAIEGQPAVVADGEADRRVKQRSDPPWVPSDVVEEQPAFGL